MLILLLVVLHQPLFINPANNRLIASASCSLFLAMIAFSFCRFLNESDCDTSYAIQSVISSTDIV